MLSETTGLSVESNRSRTPMSKPDRSRVIKLTDASRGIPGPAGEHAISVMRRGTANVKLSLPTRPNQQTPHSQDEIYVIIRGRGVLFHDGRRDPFESGDLLFVAAGIDHWFEDFSDDLAVWVIFYGAEAGEIPAGA
jgi:mannose-6-phosphate isomerase-like protein (cupin superfamily)